MSSHKKALESARSFITDEENNVAELEIKSLEAHKIHFCIADAIDFTVDLSSGVKFVSSDETLEVLMKNTNDYIEDNEGTSLSELLSTMTDLWLEEMANEEEDEEDPDGELEDTGTPFDPSLTDEFDPFSFDKPEAKKQDPEWEKIEKLKKQFDLKGANQAAVSRLLKDYSTLQSLDSTKIGFRAYPKGKNLFDWEVRLFNFDEKEDPIAKDLKTLKKKRGIDYVTMSMKFPPEYPFKPPFIRVVSPRMQFRTGHVTIGGSICMQLLTTSGWMPANSIEAIFVQIRLAMAQGGCRIDFGRNDPYTEYEAKEAYYRVARRYGWEK